MTLFFRKVEFNNIMELNGTLDFLSNKVIVLYGSNQQGKTNIINAIRYAFLKQVKPRGSRNKYDEWALPRRDEMVFGDEAKVRINFEYNGVPYILERRITLRREETELYQADKASEKLDPEDFLKRQIKTSLLDSLFAPEISGGFKHLYNGTLEESIHELFKEISTLRMLCDDLKERLDRMKENAETAKINIEDEYNKLYKEISEVLNPSEFEEIKNMENFDAEEILTRFEIVEKTLENLLSIIEETKKSNKFDYYKRKVEAVERIREKLKSQEIIEKVMELQIIKNDLPFLERIVKRLRVVESPEKSMRIQTFELKDKKLNKRIGKVFDLYNESYKKYKKAKQLANKIKINLETVDELSKEYNNLLSIIKDRKKLRGKKYKAFVSVNKEGAYVLLDVKLLFRNPKLSKINRNPIPEGDSNIMKIYLSKVKKTKSIIDEIRKSKKLSEELFSDFKKEREGLSNLTDRLREKSLNLEKEIRERITNLCNDVSAYTGSSITPIENITIEEVKEQLDNLSKLYQSTISKDLNEVNELLKELKIPPIKEFTKKSLEEAETRLMERELRRDVYHSLRDKIQGLKKEWYGKMEAYKDYCFMLEVAPKTKLILEQIKESCFDEKELRNMLIKNFDEIMADMIDKKLLNIEIRLGYDRMNIDSITYRGKDISHPAGSEKAFITLAVLTVLGHYFKCPILIDEVANNLDSRNLRAFFELVVDYSKRYGIQYILAVKETRDFDIDTWVKDLKNDLVIYMVTQKTITPLEL